MRRTVSEVFSGPVTVTTTPATLYDLVWLASPDRDPARVRPQIGITLKADADNDAKVIIRNPVLGGNGYPLAAGEEIEIPIDDTKTITLTAVSGNQTVYYLIQ